MFTPKQMLGALILCGLFAAFAVSLVSVSGWKSAILQILSAALLASLVIVGSQLLCGVL